MRQGDLFRHISKAETVKGCVDSVVGVVEDKLAVDPDFDLAAFLLELPRPNAAAGRVPLGDAVMANEVLSAVMARGGFLKYEGAPTTAKRMSGPMRTEIMSLASCSPMRTPAS